MEETSEKSIAVLIDADNTPGKKLKLILQEIAVHGHIITKRAYGDFSSEHLKNWKRDLNDNAIIPIQQFAYTQGKNSSDSAMIIDAMDLLYTDKYDSIALVTSDSDFTKLATRLRESQIYVFGVGQKKTPPSFVNACDDFIYIENLTDDEEGRRVCCKLGTEPETATPGDFWRITPGWMAREQEAGRLELHPEGLGPEEQARIDNYNREKSNF